MKNKILVSILLVSTVTLANRSVADQNDRPENQVPESWYTLPENSPNSARLMSGRGPEADAGAITKTMGKIFSAYTESLEKSELGPARTNRWHLSRMSADVGLSHGGRLGLLPFKGTATSAIFWRRAQDRNVNSESDNAMNLEFRSTMSESQIRQQTEVMTQAVLATGKIRNANKFRSNMFEITEEFLSVARHLVHTPHPYWKVSRYYLDRTFSASGDLISGVGTSAEVRLRMSWKVEAGSVSNAKLAANNPKAQMLQNHLTDLFVALADDMTWAAAQFPADAGFSPKSFRFGLGFGRDLDVGVVKVGLDAMGHLELERTNAALPALSEIKPTGGEISLMASAPTEQELAYAKANGITIKPILPDGSIIDRMAYRVKREKIRAGMSYAMQMAAKMVEPAKGISKSWEVYRLDMSFQMGVGGAFALPILNGTSTTQISFVKN